MAAVVDNVLELIGGTPLLRLEAFEEEGSAEIWGKAEHLNPGGSVKDRPCLAMIEDAEKEGLLKSGATVVEPTSGNTGIGLALVCAVRGYKLVLTMPESMSLERRALLEAYGAEIVLTPAEKVMQGAVEEAKRIAEERGAFMPAQFSNAANPKVHAQETAKEICESLAPSEVDVFVAAVGTGGTVTGVGRALRESQKRVRIVAVEPETSPVLSGGCPGPTKIQGIGAGFVPDNYDASVVDEVRRVSDQDSFDTKVALAKRAGLLVGITAGANVKVAQDLAREVGPGKRVVTILCDTGERYFSLDRYFTPSDGAVGPDEALGAVR